MEFCMLQATFSSSSLIAKAFTYKLQVLCFDAYFQEAVHEKREEQYRIRRYKLKNLLAFIYTFIIFYLNL